jgi:hypothetical protein
MLRVISWLQILLFCIAIYIIVTFQEHISMPRYVSPHNYIEKNLINKVASDGKSHVCRSYYFLNCDLVNSFYSKLNDYLFSK